MEARAVLQYAWSILSLLMGAFCQFGFVRHGSWGLLLIAAWASACAGQSLTSGSDSAAQVVSLAGQVQVLRDSTPWALNAGHWVYPRQVVVTGPDGHATFRVADGSTFEVYPNSQVTFRRVPGNWRELLDVWIGRVRVHIQRIGGQPNFNRIQTPTAVISVRGTTFDVVVEGEDDTTLVAVEEGQVEVRHALLPDGRLHVLGAGEHVRIHRDLPLALANGRGGRVGRSLRAIAEVLQNVAARNGPLSGPTPSGGGSAPLPVPGGGTTRPPVTGDTGGTPPPPPPPPPPGA